VTTRKEIDDSFFRGECIPPLRFTLNDSVTVTVGASQGKTGSVVSIVSIEPEVVLLVELDDGTGDARVAQSALTNAGPSSVGPRRE